MNVWDAKPGEFVFLAEAENTLLVIPPKEWITKKFFITQADFEQGFGGSMSKHVLTAEAEANLKADRGVVVPGPAPGGNCFWFHFDNPSDLLQFRLRWST